MDLLTLDTNVIRDWLWIEGKLKETRYDDDPDKKREVSEDIDKLKNLVKSNKSDLAVTTQLFTDLEIQELPSPFDKFIGKTIKIATPSIFMSPFSFPITFVKKQDVDKLLLDLFPGSKKSDRYYIKKRKDALQVLSHKVAKRDYFVTSDKALLRQRKIIKERWGIDIISLGDYISMAG